MAKSYMKDARRHVERIKHYHTYGGANGYSQAIYHYNQLEECYKKSASKLSGEAAALHQMYVDAGKLMEIMKSREDGELDDESTS